MKIYLIDEKNEAKQILQLLKLNADCVQLYWSRTINNIPNQVSKALEVIEAFVEERVYKVCSEQTMFHCLSEVEENEIVNLLKEIPELKSSLGTGVILQGEEADTVRRLLSGKKVPIALVKAISSGKNIIIF